LLAFFGTEGAIAALSQDRMVWSFCFRVEALAGRQHIRGRIVATIKKLAKLFNALAEHNVHRAEQVAVDIVGEEEKKGHHGAAKVLRGSLRPNGISGLSSTNGNLQYPIAARLLSDALSPQHCTVRLSQVALRDNARSELNTVIREWHSQKALETGGGSSKEQGFFLRSSGMRKESDSKSTRGRTGPAHLHCPL